MKICKYGLELKEVEREDLELIRQFRNSATIKKKMLHREQISRIQQLEWFKEIQTINHFYFLIYKDDSAVGLINGKNINYQEKSSEGGIFLWDTDRSYEISITASIILNDWNFFINDFKYNYAKVLKSNKQAIAYNQFMGYKIIDRVHENPEVIWMMQTKKDYESFREKIQKLGHADIDISDSLKIEDIYIRDEEVDYARRLIEKIPKNQQSIYERIINRS